MGAGDFSVLDFKESTVLDFNLLGVRLEYSVGVIWRMLQRSCWQLLSVIVNNYSCWQGAANN